jgi:deazaflavin-dependent oxidoreductase (nitroreductase family)
MSGKEQAAGTRGAVLERTHTLDRWLYRGKRPNRLARLINGALARLAGAGIGPGQLVMLEVAGRRTGETISFPVVVADYQGERYLVSMLGDETNWVRNVRAANGRAMLRRGHREVIQLEEVDPGQRAAILRRYLELSPGARSHIPVGRGAPVAEFDRIAAQYPVFHVTMVLGGICCTEQPSHP